MVPRGSPRPDVLRPPGIPQILNPVQSSAASNFNPLSQMPPPRERKSCMPPQKGCCRNPFSHFTCIPWHPWAQRIVAASSDSCPRYYKMRPRKSTTKKVAKPPAASRKRMFHLHFGQDWSRFFHHLAEGLAKSHRRIHNPRPRPSTFAQIDLVHRQIRCTKICPRPFHFSCARVLAGAEIITYFGKFLFSLCPETTVGTTW